MSRSQLSLEFWAPDMLSVLSHYLSANDIARISCVCKAYKNLMWDRLVIIHFDQHQKRIDNSVLLYVSTHSLHLQKVILRDCYKIDDSGLSFLTRYLEDLWYLDIANCTKVSDKGVGYIVLQKNIRYLDISGKNWISNYGLRRISSQLSILETLRVSYNSNISDTALEDLQDLKRLRVLSLEGVTGITPQSIPVLHKFPALKVLNLKNCMNLFGCWDNETVSNCNSRFTKFEYNHLYED